MSSFSVTAHTLTVEDHPNADRLSICHVDGTEYVSISAKLEDGTPRYKTGDLALYIPEQAIVPKKILVEMGLWNEMENKGMLAGSAGDRVKAIRLRGTFSQGLLYRPVDRELEPGHDYAEELGVYKWLPPIPLGMAGEIYPCPDIRSYTDIENVKAWPHVLEEGETVLMSEKIHGTCSIYYWDGTDLHVSSKGQASKGFAIKPNKDEHGRYTNIYWQVAEKYNLLEIIPSFCEVIVGDAVTFYGETYGLQDLKYGTTKANLQFRVFDVAVRNHDQWRYLDAFVESNMVTAIRRGLFQNLDIVPDLYIGPYSHAKLLEVTNGPEMVSGEKAHMREGVVVRPGKERYDPELGRVILKSISEKYLLRSGGTEFE